MEKEDLNRKIMVLVCQEPGKTIAQIVDAVFNPAEKSPSRDTIRRHIYRLGALGYLTLRQEITVYPTAKGKKSIMGNGRPSPEA